MHHKDCGQLPDAARYGARRELRRQLRATLRLDVDQRTDRRPVSQSELARRIAELGLHWLALGAPWGAQQHEERVARRCRELQLAQPTAEHPQGIAQCRQRRQQRRRWLVTQHRGRHGAVGRTAHQHDCGARQVARTTVVGRQAGGRKRERRECAEEAVRAAAQHAQRRQSAARAHGHRQLSVLAVDAEELCDARRV